MQTKTEQMQTKTDQWLRLFALTLFRKRTALNLLEEFQYFAWKSVRFQTNS